MRPWKYENTMSFIIPYIEERPMKSNLLLDSENSIESISHIGKEAHEATDEAHEAQEHEATDEPVELETPPKKNKLPKLTGRNATNKSTNNTDPTVGQVLQDYLHSKRNRVKETSTPTDALGAFFKAMEGTVRSFSVPLQIDIKGKISNLVNEYELKNYEAQQEILKPPSPLYGQSSSISSSPNL